MSNPLWATTSEIAKQVGVNRKLLTEWLKKGAIEGAFQLPAVPGSLKGGVWRVPKTAAELFVSRFKSGVMPVLNETK